MRLCLNEFGDGPFSREWVLMQIKKYNIQKFQCKLLKGPYRSPTYELLFPFTNCLSHVRLHVVTLFSSFSHYTQFL